MADLLSRLIKVAVMTEKAASWPTYDGKSLKRFEYITASEATKCLRSLAFQKNEEKEMLEAGGEATAETFWEDMPEEEFERRLERMADSKYGIFARGHNVEAWVVDRIAVDAAKQGLEFALTGEDQVSFYSNLARVSGTPDGVMVNKKEFTMHIVEIKSAISPVSQPRYAHVRQVLLNAGLITYLRQKLGDKKFAKLMGWKEWLVDDALPEMKEGKLLYINPSNYLTLQEFEVEYDNRIFFADTAKRAGQLFGKKGKRLRKPEELPAEGLTNNGCRFCEYKTGCLKLENETKDEAYRQLLNEKLKGEKPVMPKLPTFSEEEGIEGVIRCIRAYADENEKKKASDKLVKGPLRTPILKWLSTQKDDSVKFVADGVMYSVNYPTSIRQGSIDADALDKFFRDEGFTQRSEDFRKPSSSVSTLTVSYKDSDE